MITVHLTDHARYRIRKRFSINKKSVDNFAQKAFNKGMKKSITQGDLKKYMGTRNYQENNIFCKCYSNGIFVFKNIKIHEVLLISCWPLPGRLNTKYKQAQDKTNEKRNLV